MMVALYKSHGLSATISAAIYSEQSTRRIRPGITSASGYGVYSILFCSMFSLREEEEETLFDPKSANVQCITLS